ncbi:ammonia-dependent NAD(+) synthetase [Bacillus sp. SD088]|uniref:ammonia-dependent NAD(+) synthetase n=1 Tax=Bacillus sp. SD088 TaxID=2782012 RepID=UPI001A962195|nr:ammonia-dependent NAD(+) synthetase [Bacillus sp. SD088]MBO0994992.1 ammonia-dependent NAD(+) synthetase [Bacillus sp. SD088]
MDTLQKKIIEELKVSPNIDPNEEIRKSIDFMKAYLNKYGFFNGFVLGISGGQDSTLVGKLAQMAVDELNQERQDNKYQFIALKLPYGAQADMQDVEDALTFIQPSQVYEINIQAAVNASVKAIQDAGISISDFTKGNEKARERMKAQYSVAAHFNAIVLGTDHSAEALTGFYTKFGDGGSDLVPIYRLNKRQGRKILMELGCPEHLYLKIPTADLEDDRPLIPDEVALGVSYEEIDDYLEGKKVPETAKNTIEALYRKSAHKRHLPINIFDDFWH